MSKDFDPYHKWLGIPAREQPADHYRLLGVERFEDDADVISLAADQRMHFLRSFQNGERAKLSQQLLNEIAAARVCLLDEKKKAAYDANLKQKTAGATQSKLASAETPVEDLAATLEFAAPEMASEWPPGPVADSNAANLWSPKSESSKDELAVSKTQGSPKTKTRVLIVSLLSSLALLLFLGVVIAGVGREAGETAKNDTDGKNPAVAAEQTEEEKATNEIQEAADQQQRLAREAADRKEAEKKRTAAADRKAAAEAAQRKKEQRATEQAKREVARKEQEHREKQRIKRAIEDFQQKVEQSIDKADRLKNDSPDQALDVLRECRTAVDAAQVPPQLKQYYRQRLRSIAADIRHRAAAQKAKQKKEDEEKRRREHPEEYLQSLGLEKEKNGWHIEAALKLNALNKPLAKRVTEYKRKTKEIKGNEGRIKQQENKIDTGMKKLPIFQDPQIRKWVLDGMPDYPDAPKWVRQMVDKGRERVDHFRAQAPTLANKLEQKVRQLQSAKNQLQGDREAIEEIVDKIANLDEQARFLLQSIKETEQQLAEEKRNFDAAIQSTGLGFKESNTTNVENLLKKAEEILNDDLFRELDNDQ